MRAFSRIISQAEAKAGLLSSGTASNDVDLPRKQEGEEQAKAERLSQSTEDHMVPLQEFSTEICDSTPPDASAAPHVTTVASGSIYGAVRSAEDENEDLDSSSLLDLRAAASSLPPISIDNSEDPV